MNRKAVICIVVSGFLAVLTGYDLLLARRSVAATLDLPEPTTLLQPGFVSQEPEIIGLSFAPDKPLNLKFLVDTKGARYGAEDEKRLVESFLLALTVPDEYFWVNLSPHDTDRIMPTPVARTRIGEILLKQDYLLKLFTASCVKNFAHEVGDVNQKVWIKATDAGLLEDGNTVIIDTAGLTVESENGSDVFAQKVLPVIQKEVERGRRFSDIRSLYRVLLLARWFKDKVAGSDYAEYLGTGKIGRFHDSPSLVREKVFYLYQTSYRKGVYDVVESGRRYFSGGIDLLNGNTHVYPVNAGTIAGKVHRKGVIGISSSLVPLSSSALATKDRIALLNLMNSYHIAANGRSHWQIAAEDGAAVSEASFFAEKKLRTAARNALSENIRKISQYGDTDSTGRILDGICEFMRATYVKRVYLSSARKLGMGKYEFVDLLANAYVPVFFKGSKYEDFNDFVLAVKTLLATDKMRIANLNKPEKGLRIILNNGFAPRTVVTLHIDDRMREEVRLWSGCASDKIVQLDVFCNLIFGEYYRTYLEFVSRKSGLGNELAGLRKRQPERSPAEPATEPGRDRTSSKRKAVRARPPSSADARLVEEQKKEIETSLKYLNSELLLMDRERKAVERKMQEFSTLIKSVEAKLEELRAETDNIASYAACEEVIGLNVLFREDAMKKLADYERRVTDRRKEVRRSRTAFLRGSREYWILREEMQISMKKAAVSIPEDKAGIGEIDQKLASRMTDLKRNEILIDELLEQCRREKSDLNKRRMLAEVEQQEKIDTEKKYRKNIAASLKRRLENDERLRTIEPDDSVLFSSLGLMDFAECFAEKVPLTPEQIQKGTFDDEERIERYVQTLLSYERSSDTSPRDVARLAFAGISLNEFNEFLVKNVAYDRVETEEMIDFLLSSEEPSVDISALQISRTRPGELPMQNVQLYSQNKAKFRTRQEVLRDLGLNLDVIKKIARVDESRHWVNQQTGLEAVMAFLQGRKPCKPDLARYLRYFFGVENDDFISRSIRQLQNTSAGMQLRREMEHNARAKGQTLDEAHYAAVLKSIDPDPSNRVVLLHGPAGTGKTTVLSEIVRQYARQGKRVLVFTHTHKASQRVVDAIARNAPAVALLRLARNKQKLTPEEREKYWSGNHKVFNAYRKKLRHKGGCVHVGTGTGYYNDKRALAGYDVIIVDESSQMSLPEYEWACLEAFRSAVPAKVILIGDHYQLPVSDVPLDGLDINESEAAAFRQSIFEFMADRGLFDQIMLSTCYRMDNAISRFISTIFYKGNLIPGGKTEKKDALKIVDISSAKTQHQRVLVHREGDPGAHSSKKNDYSAQRVLENVLELMNEERYREEDILVVTPYMGQKEAVQDLLAKNGLGYIEVRTIDSVPVTGLDLPDGFTGFTYMFTEEEARFKEKEEISL